MYTNMEDWTEIRRAVLVGGLSKRQACRQFNIHFNTLQKILAHSIPPGCQRVPDSCSVSRDRRLYAKLHTIMDAIDCRRRITHVQRNLVYWNLSGSGSMQGGVLTSAEIRREGND